MSAFSFFLDPVRSSAKAEIFEYLKANSPYGFLVYKEKFLQKLLTGLTYSFKGV